MHDWWTKNGSHYLSVYIVMMKKVKRLVGGNEVVLEELPMNLVSLYPIAKRDKQGNLISFKLSLSILRHTYGSLIMCSTTTTSKLKSVCQIFDSYALNKCIAEKMKKPHVDCCNHKLELEVIRMAPTPTLK